MNSEPYNLTKEELDKWVKDACLKAIGYLKVTNYGGKYALVETGIYTIVDRGHEVVQNKSRQAMYSIFLRLINKYLNFERNGYAYHYSRGSWHRKKENTLIKKNY